MCIKRKLLWVVVLLLALISLNGCLTVFEEDYMREAVKYMEKKYGEEFNAHYYVSGSRARVYVNPVSCPEWQVTVFVPETKLWGVKFEDNYVGFLLKGELEQTLEEIAGKVYRKCKVICPPQGWSLPGEWNRDTSLEIYNTHNISNIHIYVSADLANKDEDLKLFLESYRESGININIITLTYISEQQLDGPESRQKSEENWINQVSSKESYYFDAFIVLDGEMEGVDKISWRRGDLEF